MSVAVEALCWRTLRARAQEAEAAQNEQSFGFQVKIVKLRESEGVVARDFGQSLTAAELLSEEEAPRLRMPQMTALPVLRVVLAAGEGGLLLPCCWRKTWMRQALLVCLGDEVSRVEEDGIAASWNYLETAGSRSSPEQEQRQLRQPQWPNLCSRAGEEECGPEVAAGVQEFC